ncbi:hypothetical protein BH10BAC4_BH10BAC4_19760 [soil metagenome]
MLLLLLPIPYELPNDLIKIRIKINRDIKDLSELTSLIKAFDEVRPNVTLIKLSVNSPPVLEILSDYHWLVEFIATISGLIGIRKDAATLFGSIKGLVRRIRGLDDKLSEKISHNLLNHLLIVQRKPKSRQNKNRKIILGELKGKNQIEIMVIKTDKLKKKKKE